MKFSGNIVRKGVLSKLVGNVTYNASTVPVVGNVPNNITYPYIKVDTPQVNESDFNNGSFMTTVNVVIDVVTRAKSDLKGYGDSDAIANEVTQIMRTRSADYMDLSEEGFAVYRQTVSFINHISEAAKDNYYYRTIINMDLMVQEIDQTLF